MKPAKYRKEAEPLYGKETDSDPFYLRGYCRVCNRHYFYRNKLDTEHIQFHQHHAGVCQNCRYGCVRIKPKTKRVE